MTTLTNTEIPQFLPSGHPITPDLHLPLPHDNHATAFPIGYLNLFIIYPHSAELFSFSSLCVNDMPLLFDSIFDYTSMLMNVQLQAPHPSMLTLLHQAVTFTMRF